MKNVNRQWKLILILLLIGTVIYVGTLIIFPVAQVRLTNVIFIFFVFAHLIWFFYAWVRTVTDPIGDFLANYNPAWKLFASTYTGVATVILLFFNKEIVDGSRYGFEYLSYLLEIDNSINPSRYSFDFWVSLYWLFLIIWVIDYIVFVRLEAKANQKSKTESIELLDEIRSAVYGAPNAKIFNQYYIVYDDIYDWFRWLNLKSSKDGHQLPNYNSAFRQVLHLIANLTQGFTRDGQGIYGVNIMIYIPNKPDYEAMLKKIVQNSDAWIHYKNVTDIQLMRGILHGVPALKIEDHRETEGKPLPKPRKVPSVNLPIFRPETGHRTIPGACSAALSERAEYVMNDVLDVDSYFKAHDDDRRQESIRFFSGAGNEIKSFFSMRVPLHNIPKSLKGSSDPLTWATLNVDCSEKWLLGKNERYYEAYFSLLRPISVLFAPYIEQYLELLLAETKRNN